MTKSERQQLAQQYFEHTGDVEGYVNIVCSPLEALGVCVLILAGLVGAPAALIALVQYFS